jgi:hypothetical protein
MPPIITRNHEYAKILSRTVRDNKGFTSLANKATFLDSATVTQIVSGVSVNSMTIYDTYDSLPSSNLTKGNQAFVRATSHMYISDSNRWFSAAFINLTPTQTLDPAGNVTLSIDGTSTIVTITATDSDQPDAHLTYSVESDGNMLATGTTITQDSSVFTITPLSEDSGGVAGNFTLTFKTTDSVNIATTTKDFSLAFVTTVAGSASTVLLMKAAGNSATNANITYQNSSDVSTGFTETGAPAASTFSPYRSGGYSTYFDGTGDYISFPSTSTTVPGASTDFSIEFWLNTIDNSDWTIFDNTGAGGNMQISKISNTYYVHYLTAGDGWSMAVSNNEWHHWAIIHSSSNDTSKVYVDGTLVKTLTGRTQSFGSLSTNTIGRRNDGYYHLKGYLRDFRFVLGSQVYTSDFTPPTEPLTAISGTSVLACHLPYFADGSTNGHTLTPSGNVHTQPFGPYDYSAWTADDVGGSVYFDGNDYLTASDNASFDFGTGDFTIEAWVNLDAMSGDYFIISASGSGGLFFGFRFGTQLGFGRAAVAWDYNTPSGITTGGWHHVAFVRSSGTVYLFVNGKSVGTPGTHTDSYDLSLTSLNVGSQGANYYLNGYISDLRVIKGTAQYTSNFTPPTAPLSHTGSGTSLLMNNKSDANIYDAAAGNTFKLINDTQSSTAQRKFTTSSSVYFDGTGDAIELPDKQDLLTFGTGDFTIECWFRPSVVNINTAIMDFRPNSTTGSYPFIQPVNTNLKMKNVSSGDLTASGVLAANTWIHIAVVRKNGTTTLYTDGVSRDTGADTTDYSCRSVPNIGKHNYAGSNLNGYLQDLRITKGYGRYTANFTPPTTEFEL